MSGRGIIRIPALVAVFIVAIAAPASAQTGPTTNAYGGQQGEVLGNFQGSAGQSVPDVIPPPAGGEAPRVTPSVPDTEPVERGVDAPITPTVAKGQLPFTGFEAGLVALAGLALFGTGFAMRRASRSDA